MGVAFRLLEIPTIANPALEATQGGADALAEAGARLDDELDSLRALAADIGMTLPILDEWAAALIAYREQRDG